MNPMTQLKEFRALLQGIRYGEAPTDREQELQDKARELAKILEELLPTGSIILSCDTTPVDPGMMSNTIAGISYNQARQELHSDRHWVQLEFVKFIRAELKATQKAMSQVIVDQVQSRVDQEAAMQLREASLRAEMKKHGDELLLRKCICFLEGGMAQSGKEQYSTQVTAAADTKYGEEIVQMAMRVLSADYDKRTGRHV